MKKVYTKRPLEQRPYHFIAGDAIQYGVEKAILISNFRFWLDKELANKDRIYDHKGKKYCWTYSSSTSFSEIFPFFSPRSIRRWLVELEKEGILISGNFNKRKYDQTKWYTMPEYEINL